MFRPYKVTSDVLTGCIHGKGVAHDPQSCSQWMDPKVTPSRPTDRLWRKLNNRIRSA